MHVEEKIFFEGKVIAFDFDGVLVDSVSVKTKAFETLYGEYGSAVVADVRDHHLRNGGMSRFKKFAHYHQNILGKEISFGDLERLSQQFSQIVVKKVVAAKWIRGAKIFLEHLKECQNLCAIISATPQAEMEYIVKERNMNQFFSVIYGSPSSKSENLRDLLDRFSIDPSQVVFFGDALADWQAAREVGVFFFGVGEVVRSIEEYNRRPREDFFIDDFEVLNKIFEN